jgi:hypothetical protein
MHGDISTIRKKHNNKSYVQPNWFMLVDAATGIKFSSFWNTKKSFIEPTCRMLHQWGQQGIGFPPVVSTSIVASNGFYQRFLFR